MIYKIRTISAILAVMLMVGVASAGEFHLINSNVPQLAGIDIKVTTDGAGPTMKVELVANPLINTPLGIDQFFYQLDGVTYAITSEDDPSGIWHTNFDGGVADGFGTFASLKNDNPGGTGGISSPITFTLANPFTDADILVNDHTAKFAVHIRYDGSCSGFVSDGTTTSLQDNPNCRSTTQIPEFPTMALPVAAAMGLVFFFQRNKRKE